ncbi:MAG: hypothetical protein OXE77_06805 [Flavobacteriaceae bacterium]|nr:hypothetical protein [Flavobacteriaceae bacterium]MCY4268161.1 hypothetical protein [Flavobacteriaceae bacterium]MCY4298156.1 hypothetical protein [Flavobacteriaceae bacterium]
MAKKIIVLILVLFTFSHCLYVMFPHEFEVKVDFNEDSPNHNRKNQDDNNAEKETQSTQFRDSIR